MERWVGGSPYSAFVIILKVTNEPIGHFATAAKDPGVASMELILDRKFTRQGYGSEVMNAATTCWFPYLVHAKQQAAGKCLTKVQVSVVLENPLVKILEKYGFQKDENSIRKRKLTVLPSLVHEGGVKEADEADFNLVLDFDD